MHTIMIVIGLFGAVIIRCARSPQGLSYTQRWQQTLFYFLFPPLLLLMTAMAVFCMGTQGRMLGLETGYWSYGLTLGFLGSAIAVLCWQFDQGARSSRKLSQYPTISISDSIAHILPTSLPYSAQIGGWNSKLVISEGLFSLLDSAHLNAVIAHEKAHLYYRDTFWFFWLGWLYRITAWLPNSVALWEELLLLRELRADWKATQTVDSLLLAESLITVVNYTVQYPQVGCAALSCTANKSRLEERIEALINEEEVVAPPVVTLGKELVWALTPLITMPWHQC